MCGCSVLFGGVLRYSHKRLPKACFSSPGLAAIKVTWMLLAFISSAVHVTSCMFVTIAPAQLRGASTNFLPHSLVPSVPQPLNELSKQVSAGFVNVELDSRVCKCSSSGAESNDVSAPALFLCVCQVSRTCELHSFPVESSPLCVACGLEAGHSFMEAFTIEWRNSSSYL